MTKPIALIAAEKRGEEWCVLPPEVGYPLPNIGWRLMQLRKELKPKRWICIQFMHKDVVTRLVETLNREQPSFNQLTEERNERLKQLIAHPPTNITD